MQIYFLYGADQFNLNKKFSSLSQELISEGADLHVYYADEISSINQIGGLTGGMNLFSSAQVIVVRNLLKSGSKEVLKNFEDLISLKNKEEMVSLILIESGEPDKRLRLYKSLIKHASSISFPALSPKEISNFIETQLAGNGIKVQSDVKVELNYLLSGFDTFTISNELKKLAQLNNKEIQTADLAVITLNSEALIWDLVDLGVTNKSSAFKLLEKLILNDVQVQQIIGFIASQLRQLISYYYLPGSLPPFMRSKISRLAGKISQNKLHLLVSKLADLDIAIKSGKVEPRVGLYLYLLIL